MVLEIIEYNDNTSIEKILNKIYKYNRNNNLVTMIEIETDNELDYESFIQLLYIINTIINIF